MQPLPPDSFRNRAQTDRKIGIPGENLIGSHTATEFVGWYNTHLEHTGVDFDFSGKRAVIVGVGNVAVDVARILSPLTEARWKKRILPTMRLKNCLRAE